MRHQTNNIYTSKNTLANVDVIFNFMSFNRYSLTRAFQVHNNLELVTNSTKRRKRTETNSLFNKILNLSFKMHDPSRSLTYL